MKKILHVSCSPRGESAESYRLARNIVGRLLRVHPTATVADRIVGGGEVPAIDEDYAISQGSTADVSQAGSMAVSESLVRELETADCVVIGTPMHNFTVPAGLKSWIDHVVRARRTFDVTAAGKIGRLSDRPVFIAISSGGRFSGERARQPDFLTPYLQAVLGIIGLHDVTFFLVQGTGAGPDATAHARADADRALDAHFSAFEPVGVAQVLTAGLGCVPESSPSHPSGGALSPLKFGRSIKSRSGARGVPQGPQSTRSRQGAGHGRNGAEARPAAESREVSQE